MHLNFVLNNTKYIPHVIVS